MNKQQQSAKLKVGFVIDAALLGAFVHQYADKVEALSIGAVHGVPYNKNATAVGASRSEAKEIAKLAREDVLALMKAEARPLTRSEILNKLPKYPRPWLQQMLYRLAMEKVVIKTKKGQGSELVLPGAPERTEPAKKNATAQPKKPRPAGGYNFEKPEVRKKAAEAMKKRTTGTKPKVDFSELARKSNAAQKLERQQAKANGVHPPSTPPESPVAPAAGE